MCHQLLNETTIRILVEGGAQHFFAQALSNALHDVEGTLIRQVGIGGTRNACVEMAQRQFCLPVLHWVAERHGVIA